MIRWGAEKRITSFVEHPLEINLQKPFTFMAEYYSSDTFDWRTIFAFESPVCHSSLLCVVLVPRSSQIWLGYQLDAKRRIHGSADAYTPASTWFHFAFVLLDSTRFCLYINGVQQLCNRLEGSLYNPSQVDYLLYLCSCSMLTFTATEANCSGTEYAQWYHDCSVERKTQER